MLAMETLASGYLHVPCHVSYQQVVNTSPTLPIHKVRVVTDVKRIGLPIMRILNTLL